MKIMKENDLIFLKSGNVELEGNGNGNNVTQCIK